MRKYGFSVLLSLLLVLLALALPGSVLAEEAAASRDLNAAAESAEDPASLFVWDTAGILSSQEISSLQEKASALADAYQYGCYILTVYNYQQYSSYGVLDAGEALYSRLNLGIGPRKQGVFLFLSMADRDYATAYYPDVDNPAFTDYGLSADQFDTWFLDNFRNNDWYGGFSDYLSRCETYLQIGSQGEPFDYDTDPERISAARRRTILIAMGVGAALAAVLCFIFWGLMGSAKEAQEADYYTVPGSARITGRQDRFLRRSTVRRHIEKSSGGGGGGGSFGNSHSGGFSGHSGKF